MQDLTDAFFEGLTKRGREPKAVRFTGTIRFVLDHIGPSDQWRLRIDHGDIGVSRGYGPADLVVHANRGTFNEVIAEGGEEIYRAWIRHALVAEGDPRMLYALRILVTTAIGDKSGDINGNHHEG